MPQTPYVAVVGPGEATDGELRAAEDVGARLAEAGVVVVTGGLGGVMEAGSRGARSRRGRTLGILPGTDREAANGWVELAVATGLGELRNGILVRTVDGLVAVGGGHGTLSEIALALKAGLPVVGLETWAVHGVVHMSTPEDAVARIVALLRA